MAKVAGVCVSDVRGIQKKNIHRAYIKEDWGIEGDAHAGKWHRQVSLLSKQRIDAFKAEGADVEDGAFGENIIVDGIDCNTLPVGQRLRCGGALLEITQIGKECHQGCAIMKAMGKCIMPTNGVFARVLESGWVADGDEIALL